MAILLMQSYSIIARVHNKVVTTLYVGYVTVFVYVSM